NEENEKVVKTKTVLDRVNAERDRLAQDSKDWQARYEQELAKSKNTDSSREGVTAELARRKSEVDQMKTLLDARDKRMVDLEKEKKELRDRAVTNEIAARSEQERNMQLLAQLETMTKEIQRLQASGTSTGVAGTEKNPPPEDVEGVVKASDPQSGYIT